MSSDLPLFAWTPPAPPERILMTFPLDRQTGKVRDVAAKLLDKRTDRHAAFYRSQIDEAIRKRFTRLGISQREQDRQAAAFWQAVDVEIARVTYRGQRPGGSAA